MLSLSLPALADYSSWVKLRFTGPDRKQFLNGLVTNDILKLSAGKGLLTCILTPKGMLRGDFEIFDRGEDLLALASPKAGANLREDLSRKLMLSQTQMEDISGTQCLFYWIGSQAPAVTGAEILPRVMPHPPGFWILSSGESGKAVWKDLLEKGVKPLDEQAKEILRVENGVPLYGVDMDENTIPLEARLDPAVSFDKGCYMGQETIARIHFKGHINRTLAGIKFDGTELPDRGARVFAGDKEVGHLTSRVHCVEPGVLALAMVRVEHSVEKTPLRVESGGKSLSGEVISLPFLNSLLPKG